MTLWDVWITLMSQTVDFKIISRKKTEQIKGMNKNSSEYTKALKMWTKSRRAINAYTQSRNRTLYVERVRRCFLFYSHVTRHIIQSGPINNEKKTLLRYLWAEPISITSMAVIHCTRINRANNRYSRCPNKRTPYGPRSSKTFTLQEILNKVVHWKTTNCK